MVELTATTACDGLLPATKGAVTLSEVDPGCITALIPFQGQRDSLNSALNAAHGLAFPDPGRMTTGPDAVCLWTARNQVFLMGPAADDSLAEFASVTDQSDAWATVLLTGERVEEVLARLVPIDLHPAAFPVGTAARTLCQHMTVSLCRRADGFQIMAFRSMARTLAHDLTEAMASVAARYAAG